MKVFAKIICIKFLISMCFSPIYAQISYLYEEDVRWAWSECDFSKLPGANYHIMMIGDSNGALYGVSYGGSHPYFTVRNGDWVSKKWEDFMKPLPRNAPGWRVLNLANFGMTAAVIEERLKNYQSGIERMRHVYNIVSDEIERR